MKSLQSILLSHGSRCLNVALGLLCIGIFNACQWGDENLTLLKSNPDNFMVIFTDTAAIQTSTVFVDSISTLGERMLVGRYSDRYLGKVHAESYLQTVYNGGFQPDTRAVFDSVVVSLKYQYHYGDTTQLQTINVHQLTENISQKDKSHFNVNKSAYNSKPIGSRSFRSRPKRGERLSIRLSDELGNSIMEIGKSKNLLTDADWQKMFRGFAFVPGANDNGPVLGFVRDSTFMIVYYHLNNADGKDEASYQIPASTIAYNYINSDRTGTKLPVKPLSSDRISSTQTDNASFIQSGVGLLTRIDFPYMRHFKQYTNGRVRINRAMLRVTPVRDETIKILTPPTSLSLFMCNLKNQPTGVVYNGAAGATSNYLQDTFNNKYDYLLDVTQYITELTDPLENSNTMIRSDVDNGGGLLLRITNEYNNSLERIVIGDQRHGKYSMKLEIYYTYVNMQ